MEVTITRKKNYGYVGPVKRASTLIKVNGQTVARIIESFHNPGEYFAEFSFNGGRTYTWSWSSHPDREKLLQEVEKQICRWVADHSAPWNFDRKGRRAFSHGAAH